MTEKHLFTSESVTEGHPDKIADQISDSVVDGILSRDPLALVACECLVTTGLVLVAGEIHTETYVDIPSTVRGVIRDIGYVEPHLGFDFETAAVLISIDEQSGDFALGVDRGGAVLDREPADCVQPRRATRDHQPGSRPLAGRARHGTHADRVRRCDHFDVEREGHVQLLAPHHRHP